MDDLISRQSALDALDKHFESFIKRFGYDSYERADEKTKLVCDGLSEAEDVIIGLPSATDTNVGTKLVIDPYKIECAIRGLTEWQKHVQTESDIDRDISVAVEALKAQLGTNLAEVGTDCISRQAAIEALKNDMASLDHIIKGMSANDVRLGAYVSQRNQVNYDIYIINNLPPALGTNLAEVGTDCISRQALLDKFEPWLKVKDYNDGELNMLKAILYEIRFMRPAEPKRG